MKKNSTTYDVRRVTYVTYDVLSDTYYGMDFRSADHQPDPPPGFRMATHLPTFKASDEDPFGEARQLQRIFRTRLSEFRSAGVG